MEIYGFFCGRIQKHMMLLLLLVYRIIYISEDLTLVVKAYHAEFIYVQRCA